MPKPNLNQKGDTPNSKVDLLSGKHTASILVSILFVITLCAFVYILCNSTVASDKLITGFFTLLGIFAGFFAGTKFHKEG